MYFLMIDQGNKDTERICYIFRFCSLPYLTYHKLYRKHKAIDFSLTLQSQIIVDRYTDTILDDYGGYETLKQTKLSTDQSFVLERDEVIKDSAYKGKS